MKIKAQFRSNCSLTIYTTNILHIVFETSANEYSMDKYIYVSFGSKYTITLDKTNLPSILSGNTVPTSIALENNKTFHGRLLFGSNKITILNSFNECISTIYLPKNFYTLLVEFKNISEDMYKSFYTLEIDSETSEYKLSIIKGE